MRHSAEEHRAIAFEELEPGAWFEPGFTERWENRGVPITVTVQPRGEAAISVQLPIELQVVT